MKKQISILLLGLSVLVTSAPFTANVALSQESNTLAQRNSNSLEDRPSDSVKKAVLQAVLQFYAAEPAEQEQYTDKTLSLLLEKGAITQVEARKLRPVFLASGRGKVKEASNPLKELKAVASSDLLVYALDSIESDNNNNPESQSAAGDWGAVVGGLLGAAVGGTLGEVPGGILGAKLGSDLGRAVGETIAGSPSQPPTTTSMDGDDSGLGGDDLSSGGDGDDSSSGGDDSSSRE